MPLPRLIFVLLLTGLTLSARAGEPLRISTDQALQASSSVSWPAWVGKLVEVMQSVDPAFAERELVVRLQHSRHRNPIAFGRIRRSDPPEIRLQVHPAATMDALLDDWRGFHEFAHLFIPFPGNDDIWFAEGLASYYQHLLQVRAGVIDADEAWRRMFEGFQRGIDDPAGRGRPLVDLSPDMWRERAFRRVYWTGAAYFLRVDVRLRQASGGVHSVDSALAAFNRCCRDSERGWDARRLIDTLGRLSDPDIWREEYERMIDAPAQPDLEAGMAALGIEWRDDGIALSSDDSRPLREAIAHGVGENTDGQHAASTSHWDESRATYD